MALDVLLSTDARLILASHGLTSDGFLGLSSPSDSSSGAPPGSGGGTPSFGQTFNGGTSADVFVGGDQNDLVFGGGGSDSLSGGAGTDSISSGADVGGARTAPADMTVLQGLGGADTLHGGAGHDMLYGQGGNDVIVAGSGFETIYGGQGDDAIDARAVTAGDHALYISGDIGNDFVYSGLGSEIVLTGPGDDVVRSGNQSGLAGTLQQIFGNQGNDLLSCVTAGDGQVFGGQGDDVVGLSGTGHLMGFGNLGDDIMVLQSAGSLYGGQGGDHLYAVGSGSHYLSGDLGSDVIYAGPGGGPSAGGYDTVIGGRGSDDIHLSSADLSLSLGGLGGVSTPLSAQGAASLVYVAGDSTAAAPGVVGVTGTENLDRIFDFKHAVTASDGSAAGGDQIHLASLPSLVTPGLLSAGNVAIGAASDYAGAFDYAYGGGGHFTSGVAYLEVQVSGANAQGAGFYLFANDASHTALFFSQGTAGVTLQTGDVVAG
ncbi:MAG: hypothetical protein INR64_07880 [Caulobacteraceae bacterium]|nr:hypothetical protein [Caulobacter sp.]